MKKLILGLCLSFSGLFLEPALLAYNTWPDSTAYASGLDFEDQAYENVERLPEVGHKKHIPAKMDLSPYCPPVKNQGRIQSCVGWAVGYGAMTIEKAVALNCTDKSVISRNAFSAMFVYNQIKQGDCLKSGSKISNALELLATTGNVPARSFDQEANNCGKQPNSQHLSIAGRNKIQDYFTLFSHREEARIKVVRVRKALAMKKPVVIGLNIKRNFYQLKNATYWWPKVGDQTPAGGHAMVVVGYDDQKEAFLLLNSWGTGWGKKGYIWIKYEAFGQYCKYGYLIQLAKTNPPKVAVSTPALAPAIKKPANTNSLTHNNWAAPKETQPTVKLAGKFAFAYNQQRNSLQFKAAPVQLNNGVYHLVPSSWKIGQQFQLWTKNLEKAEYLYVLSKSPNGKVAIHWPRKGQFNQKFQGRNESALLLGTETEVVIPGKKRVLTLGSKGKDQLIILFAHKKIRGLKKLALAIQQAKGPLWPALQRILGKHMLPKEDIQYRKDAIQFKAVTKTSAFIVPLLVEVVAE